MSKAKLYALIGLCVVFTIANVYFFISPSQRLPPQTKWFSLGAAIWCGMLTGYNLRLAQDWD